MQRVLKSTALEQSPGGEVSIDIRDSDIDAASDKDLVTHRMASLPASEIRKMMQPLKMDLAAQKRDERFRARFRLPPTEQLLTSVHATYFVTKEDGEGGGEEKQRTPGRLCLSESFLTFNSTDKGHYHDAVMPLYTIRRVERLNEPTQAFSIKIVNWHQDHAQFRLNV